MLINRGLPGCPSRSQDQDVRGDAEEFPKSARGEQTERRVLGGLPQHQVIPQQDQPPPDYFPNPSTRSPPDLPPRLETILFYATSLNRFLYILYIHIMQIYINVYNVWAELVIIYYIYTQHYILYIYTHNIIYIHYTRIYTILYIHI